MKRTLSVLLLVILCASAMLLSGCALAPAGGNSGSGDSEDIKSVYASYVTYAEKNGDKPLSYEDWLASIKGEDGKMYLPHTLNNTVVAPPRMLIAFLENHLQADGTVTIPKALQPYMGGLEVLVPVKK